MAQNLLADLDAVVRAERDCGQTLVLKLTHQSARGPDAVRALLRGRLGDFPPLSRDELGEPVWANLDPISEADAQRLLTNVFSRDCAYRADLMPTVRAADLAQQVLSSLPSARWVTNGDLGLAGAGGGAAGWNPLTTATFDTGVIGFTDAELVAAWVTDED